MNDTQYEEAFCEAKKRVGARIAFYKHLFCYILINAMLLVVNLLAFPGHYWFQWPLLGWGIVIVLHGLRVFVFQETGLRGDRAACKPKTKRAKKRN